MFAESMLEISWAQRTRRGWTTLTSFGLQAFLLATLITIPLLRTIGIPLARTVSTPISMGRRATPQTATPPEHFHSTAVAIVPYSGTIRAPRYIPSGIPTIHDDPSVGPDIGIPSTTDFSSPYDPSSNIPLPVTGTRAVMPIPAAPPKPTFKTSSMLQGSLVRKVEPVYPAPAKSARIQGPVVLEAIIGKDGTMQNLRLVSGHPMLVRAAIEAVSQWRYKPYVLNGEAIEVETQITVNFILAN